MELLSANREALTALAVALLERETIDGVEAVEIMEEAGLSRAAGLLPEGVGTEPAVATAA